jgi:hypothetical protein
MRKGKMKIMSQVEKPAILTNMGIKGVKPNSSQSFLYPLANMPELLDVDNCPLPFAITPPLQPLDPLFPDLRLCCVFKGITRRSKRVRKCALIFTMVRK